MSKRMDLSITQDVFRNIGGKRNAGQFRIDFANFGNLLNHNWGASQRFIAPVTAGQRGADSHKPDGRCAGTRELSPRGCQQRTGDEELPAGELSFAEHAGPDVYQFMLSFRYTFN